MLLRELAAVFLKLGATSFGEPAVHVALLENEEVRRRQWLTDDEFLDLLGATNLIPGPNSTEMAMHIGLRRAGWKGLVVAGCCFIIPAFLITFACAWFYVRFARLPQLQGMLYGTKPVVLALVVQALWRLGRSGLKTRLVTGIALAALAASVLGVHELIVLFGAGVIAPFVRGVTDRPPRSLPTNPGMMLAPALPLALTTPANREALAIIERIITRHGLVELRPMLDMVLSRLESTEFEIAFFGRVSSGKSSLLNYLLGRDVLPVGVLPVTAVLTRLRPAERAELVVRYQISQPQRLPVEHIAELVTEEGNPDNKHRVAEVEVYLSSPRLAQVVAFIDTPGVGSLATFGAAQTKAYLPRCDLGVLLVDAGSSLNHEDLAILQGFHDAAILAAVLMSKADLLSEPDRNRVMGYIKRQTGEVVGGDTPVFPVSTRGPDATLADTWFDQQIVPFVEHHREHAAASMRRKIANLAETAASYLAGMLDRARVTDHGQVAGTTSQLDTTTAQQLLAADAERIAAVAVRVTEPTDKGVAEQVARLAWSASAALVEQARCGEKSARALPEHALRALAEMADGTRKQIAALGNALGESVAQLSEAFGLPPAVALDEVVSTLPPLPPADEARLRDIPDIRCPRALAVWTRFACWSLRRRIYERCGAMLWFLFSDHCAKLRT